MTKPSKKPRLYTKSNFKFIHGPRFVAPKKMSKIWLSGFNSKLPRYIVGKMKSNDKVEVQSMIRPVYFNEKNYIKKISQFDPKENEYVLNVKINPFIKQDKKLFRFYSFAFSVDQINVFISLVERNHNFRVIKKRMKGKLWYLLYIARIKK